ncbi:MAG TPA: YajD family HNH nuclease [Desulfomonilia bacterium]|nr:YajD family HNH nuclease [Desulfomonilia bacterium]
MDFKGSKPRKPGAAKLTKEEMDKIVAKARQANAERMKGYREQSLKIHPWVCARCGRHFTLKNLHLLTVHHKDHNHDNNPPDGSNWENLCVYCHDNEHGRYNDEGDGPEQMDDHTETMTHNPFAKLADMLKDKKK